MSGTEEDRRGDDRLDVTWAGTVTLQDDRHFDCRVCDVSLAGTLIRSDAPVQLGDEVLLSIPSLGDFAGEVQWAGKNSFGLALVAGPDLLLKRIAENADNYPRLKQPNIHPDEDR